MKIAFGAQEAYQASSDGRVTGMEDLKSLSDETLKANKNRVCSWSMSLGADQSLSFFTGIEIGTDGVFRILYSHEVI